MTSSTTVQQEYTERLDRLEHKIDQLIKLVEDMKIREAPLKIPARVGDTVLPRSRSAKVTSPVSSRYVVRYHRVPAL